MAKTQHPKKAWVVTVDMGYGHQRAAYPLKNIAYQGIINANNYQGIPKSDYKIWQEQRRVYEAISRFKKVPLVGSAVFEIMDQFQKIPKFYPKRDLSRPSLQAIVNERVIKGKNWGKHLIDKLSRFDGARRAKNPLPLVTPFFSTAFMAAIHGYPGEIYLIICDTDVSRAWAPVRPRETKIKYFAPCQRVVERLQMYGVPKEQIYLTGFPLPLENLGSPALGVAKYDLRYRLINLDPQKNYIKQYHQTLIDSLKIKNFPKKPNHLLTLTFAVGGAGAQRELGAEIIKGLTQAIKDKKIRVNLIAGVHHEVNKYFHQAVKTSGLSGALGKGVRILYAPSKQEYLKMFNQWLRHTDILWTKPSELSFYSALGLPIIIAPPIGSQEDFNKQYLIDLGAGFAQDNIKYINQWLFDWINSGRLAEAASQGFLEAPRLGTYNMEKILCGSQ